MNINYPLLGAIGFGAIIGWFIYYINRYRKADVQFSDLTALVGVIGGGSITALFPQGSVLFGGYGIGLFAGFFGYFFVLVLLVNLSKGEFTATWFLDGRRKDPTGGFSIPGQPVIQHPMDIETRAQQMFGAAALHTEISSQLAARMLDRLSRDPPSADAASVMAVCESKWAANKGDCNQFAIAVATALGVGGLTAPADAITATIQGGGAWRVLADGVEANAAADAGELVIGGLKGSEHDPARSHGHVVVVVAGLLAQDKYPSAYWGSLDGTPYKKTTVNFAWRAADRDKVHYAAHRLA